MRIAVNARLLLADRLEGIGWFTYHLTSRLARAHPDDDLLLFFDRPYDPRFVFADNVKAFVLRPPARHPLLWYWWFEHSLPAVLEKAGADVFFSPDGFCSLRAPTPTVLAVHDLAFERFRGHLGPLQRLYCRTFTPRYARRARRVVTVSEFSRRELVDCYGLEAAKIALVPNAAGEAFRPRPQAQAAPLVASLTGGHPFFLHVGAIHPRKNVATLLRAFDEFKTASGAATKLLLSGRLAWRYRDVLRTHAAMRHREDVVFLGYRSLEDLATLTAAALGLVSVSLYEGFGLPLVEAMASDVPVIASNTTGLAEVAGDAGLLVDPLDTHAVAQALQRLQTEPRLRTDLIHRGQLRARCFDWDRSAAELWDVLRDAATSMPRARQRKRVTSNE